MHSKCRICLSEQNEIDMHELFADQGQSKLSEKVEFCCGVLIRESLEMPNKICLACVKATHMWYNFRQMCLNTQAYLESLCCDRQRPEEYENDEEKYIEYLLEALQTIRPTTSSSVNDNLEFESVTTEDVDLDMEPQIEYHEEEDEGETPVCPFESLDMENADSFTAQEGNGSLELVQESKRDVKPTSDDNSLKNRQRRKTVKKRRSSSHSPTPVYPFESLDMENVDNFTAQEDNSCLKLVQEIKGKDAKPTSDNNSLENRHGRKTIKKCKSSSHSSTPTTFMCSACGNVYNRKSAFLYHMNKHGNVRPHECEICGKAFRQIGDLKNHIRRHTGERPYKCSYCARTFVDRSEKHRHERVHTNTRPYECQICGKSFMYSTILKNHMKLHSGQKDFNCLICSKSFTLQHQFKAHLQTITHKQKEARIASPPN